MRELKFRAWDGEIMHYDIVPWQWDFVISRSWHKCEKSTGSGILGSGGKTGEFLVPGIYFKELMEFIGVKDKNNKDIYEDDIVVAWSEGVKGTFRIKWRQEGSPCWVLYPAWNSKKMWHIAATLHAPGKQFISVEGEISTTKKEGYFDDGLEVIGNIHQNPDLLKL